MTLSEIALCMEEDKGARPFAGRGRELSQDERDQMHVKYKTLSPLEKLDWVCQGL